MFCTKKNQMVWGWDFTLFCRGVRGVKSTFHEMCCSEGPEILSHNDEVLRLEWILKYYHSCNLSVELRAESSNILVFFTIYEKKGPITRFAAIPHQAVTFGFEYDFCVFLPSNNDSYVGWRILQPGILPNRPNRLKLLSWRFKNVSANSNTCINLFRAPILDFLLLIK